MGDDLYFHSDDSIKPYYEESIDFELHTNSSNYFNSDDALDLDDGGVVGIERVDAEYFNSDLNIDDDENVEIERAGLEHFESNPTFSFGIPFDNSDKEEPTIITIESTSTSDDTRNLIKELFESDDEPLFIPIAEASRFLKKHGLT